MFTNLRKEKDRTIYKKKKCARKDVRCGSFESRVCVIQLPKLGRDNMRLYRNDSNTLSSSGRKDKY